MYHNCNEKLKRLVTYFLNFRLLYKNFIYLCLAINLIPHIPNNTEAMLVNMVLSKMAALTTVLQIVKR